MSNKREQIPLMQKGTAVWLRKNTQLTVDQIVKFCHITITDFEFLIADAGFMAFNPLSIGQLTKEEIARCEANPEATLRLCCAVPTRRKVTVRYLDRRQKEAFAGCVLWMVQNTKCNHETIGKILGRGAKFIEKVIEKNKTEQVIQKHPVEYGFCSQEELLSVINESERNERLPGCIKWMKDNTKCTDLQISKVLGCNKGFVSVCNLDGVRSKHPVECGICEKDAFDSMVSKFTS